MKKTLLAAALIVGFAGVAQAETSVTLYGILDTGYGYSNFKYEGPNGESAKATHSGIVDGTVNGSRWGMRGSEDLGDGLRAIFTLEAGINVGTGTSANAGRMFHRQSFIGLASDSWGTFTMGRQYSPSVTTNVANVGVNMADMDKAFGGEGYSNRMDNSFKYATPNFSGFEAAVAYGTGANGNGTIVRSDDQADDQDRTNWTSVGLKYSNGPLALGASYDRQHNNDGSSLAEKTLTSFVLSGAYDFEVVKLTLAYGQDRYGKMGWGNFSGTLDQDLAFNGVDSNGDAWNDFKSNNYYVGLSAPIGGGTLAASWSRSSSNLDDIYEHTKSQNIYGINYVYPLSKRTSLYTYASYGTGLGYVDNVKGQEAGVGLNVKF